VAYESQSVVTEFAFKSSTTSELCWSLALVFGKAPLCLGSLQRLKIPEHFRAIMVYNQVVPGCVWGVAALVCITVESQSRYHQIELITDHVTFPGP